MITLLFSEDFCLKSMVFCLTTIIFRFALEVYFRDMSSKATSISIWLFICVPPF